MPVCWSAKVVLSLDKKTVRLECESGTFALQLQGFLVHVPKQAIFMSFMTLSRRVFFQSD